MLWHLYKVRQKKIVREKRVDRSVNVRETNLANELRVVKTRKRREITLGKQLHVVKTRKNREINLKNDIRVVNQKKRPHSKENKLNVLFGNQKKNLRAHNPKIFPHIT